MNYLRLTLFGLLVSYLVYSNLSIADSNTITIKSGKGHVEVSGADNINININVSTGCIEGSGIAKTEQRQVPSFDAITVGGSLDVNIECQKKQGVEITGDDNILPYIITKVNGNTLSITSNGSFCPKTPLKANISVDNTEKISASGAHDVSISNVHNKKITFHLDGSGNVRASGTTGEFTIKINGSTELDAKDLKSEEVSISINGAANAVVYASRKLQANISGAGDISYYGNPKEVSQEILGVGDIVRK